VSKESDNAAFVGRFQGAVGLDEDEWAGIATNNALTDLLLRAGITAPEPAGDSLSLITVALVAEMFGASAATRKNIERYLPAIKAALRWAGLADLSMALVALATIRAETAGFELITEGVSQFNTTPGGEPFGRYDGRAALGNIRPGDGARFPGRGFVQLTGRGNYRDIGDIIGVDLEDSPELANEPRVAARILAAFLKFRQARIRAALRAGDLRQARRLVNGGSHGLEEFEAAYRAGERLLA